MVEDSVIQAYRRDGAVCLRNPFPGWLERLREGVEENLRAPSELATNHKLDDGKGRFFEDYCSWQRIAAYKAFVEESPAAALAGALMGSETVRFFHEHVLIKEPGTSKETPWHHDMPYYPVDGQQTVSFWTALDPVAKAVCPEFLAGSHLWGKLYYPRLFDDGSDYDYKDSGYETVPKIDRKAERILAWDLEPGDTIAFHYLTLHAAPGNSGQGRRRGFSTRWLGDDVRFRKRLGVTSPPYPGLTFEDGDPLSKTLFPLIWRRAA